MCVCLYMHMYTLHCKRVGKPEAVLRGVLVRPRASHGEELLPAGKYVWAQSPTLKYHSNWRRCLLQGEHNLDPGKTQTAKKGE